MVILSTGSSLSNKVQQYPAEIYKSSDEEAKIDCSHSIDNYNRILWYKQTDRDLEFLGYLLAGTEKLEKASVNVTIKGGANKGETCTLTIKDLSMNSKAVYFCAASLHSAAYLCSSVQKPPDLQMVFQLWIAVYIPLHLQYIGFFSDLIRN